MSQYFDRQGKPMDLTQWLASFESGDRIVAADDVGEATVSTVWLGLNHSFTDGPPLIFETMVFGGEHDQDQERYSTEAEALAGHRRIVESLRAEDASS
jgi:hypothetical protein